MLEDGCHNVPNGKIVEIVTSLEMLEKPSLRAEAPGAWGLRRHEAINLDAYRAIYRKVGADWLWSSRLVMPDEELASHVHSPQVELYTVDVADVDEGILELDFRESGACELAFFGLSATQIGNGAGRWLMNRAIERAWSHPIARFWLHTCTLDSPQALPFYMRSGFTPFRRQIEIADDPRLSGHSPADAAPHFPLIRSSPIATPGRE